MNGLIVVLEYLIARRLGVRPMLAAAISLIQIALFYPAMAFVSPHWLATVLTLVTFFWMLRNPLTRGREAVWLGVLSGLAALTQQPKGAATAAAVGIVLLRDAWVGRRSEGVLLALGWQLGAFALGLVAVLGLVLGAMVAAAGWWPVFDGLIGFPLGPYRQFPFHREGRWLLLSASPEVWRILIAGVSPILIINLLILIIPVSAARLIWQAQRGASAADRRPLFVAVVFASLAIFSVSYHPELVPLRRRRPHLGRFGRGVARAVGSAC